MERYPLQQLIQIIKIHLKIAEIWQSQFVKLEHFLVVVKQLVGPQCRIWGKYSSC